MRSIELTAIDLEVERSVRRLAEQVTSQTWMAQESQLDDLENPIEEEESTPAVAGAAPAMFFPITVYEDELREFYPRKAPLVGTRIVYKSGAARPVKELYAEVKAKFASLNN